MQYVYTVIVASYILLFEIDLKLIWQNNYASIAWFSSLLKLIFSSLLKLIWQNNCTSITCFSSIFISPFASTHRHFIQKHQAFEVSTKIASQGRGLWKYLFLRLIVENLSCLLAYHTSGRSFHTKSRVTLKSCRSWSNLWNIRVIMCLSGFLRSPGCHCASRMKG